MVTGGICRYEDEGDGDGDGVDDMWLGDGVNVEDTLRLNVLEGVVVLVTDTLAEERECDRDGDGDVEDEVVSVAVGVAVTYSGDGDSEALFVIDTLRLTVSRYVRE